MTVYDILWRFPFSKIIWNYVQLYQLLMSGFILFFFSKLITRLSRKPHDICTWTKKKWKLSNTIYLTCEEHFSQLFVSVFLSNYSSLSSFCISKHLKLSLVACSLPKRWNKHFSILAFADAWHRQNKAIRSRRKI